MHKKLAGDLTSLAHSILQMKNKDDVFALQQKAHELYEKLSVLAYVEEYINNTPNPTKTKEELIAEIESIEAAKEENVETEPVLEETVEEVVESIGEESAKEEMEAEVVEETVEDETETQVEEEESAPDLFEAVEEAIEEEVESIAVEIQEEIELEVTSLEEELKDTIAVDVVADLFEEAPKKSLNDKLQGDIQIGLNDRIAFVKNLFGGSQEDFNRVVSQLNTLKTFREAKKFINKMVKPDYDWTDKEEFEERFMAIVERKFV